MKNVLPLLLMLLTSCSSMTVFQSLQEPVDPATSQIASQETPQETSQKAARSSDFFYDQENKLSYRVSNNAEYLHLELNTIEQSNIAKILRNGLAVNFDTTGRKKEKIIFHYPLPSDKRMGRDQQDYAMSQNMSGNAGLQSGSMQGGSRQEDAMRGQGGTRDMQARMKRLLAGVSGEASFTRDGETELIIFNMIETDIKASMDINEEGLFHYDLKIPFSLISPGGLESIELLSLGLTVEMPDTGEMGPGGGMGGGGGRGMGGGGGGGGGMSPGGGRGGMGGGMGGPPSGTNRENMNAPLDIWFLIELQR